MAGRKERITVGVEIEEGAFVISDEQPQFTEHSVHHPANGGRSDPGGRTGGHLGTRENSDFVGCYGSLEDDMPSDEEMRQARAEGSTARKNLLAHRLMEAHATQLTEDEKNDAQDRALRMRKMEEILKRGDARRPRIGTPWANGLNYSGVKF